MLFCTRTADLSTRSAQRQLSEINDSITDLKVGLHQTARKSQDQNSEILARLEDTIASEMAAQLSDIAEMMQAKLEEQTTMLHLLQKTAALLVESSRQLSAGACCPVDGENAADEEASSGAPVELGNNVSIAAHLKSVIVETLDLIAALEVAVLRVLVLLMKCFCLGCNNLLLTWFG